MVPERVEREEKKKGRWRMEEKEGNSTELRKIAGQKLDKIHVISNRSCEFETA